MQGTAADPLGIQRVRELLSDGTESAIRALIEQDLKLAEAVDAIVLVDRLVHYYRYLFTLLNNIERGGGWVDGLTRAATSRCTRRLNGTDARTENIPPRETAHPSTPHRSTEAKPRIAASSAAISASTGPTSPPISFDIRAISIDAR